jgi:hypothetical protein
VDPSSALISQPSALQTTNNMSSTYVDIEDLPPHIAAQFPGASPPRDSRDISSMSSRGRSRESSVVASETLYQNSFDSTLASPIATYSSSSSAIPQYGFLSTQKGSTDLYTPDFETSSSSSSSSTSSSTLQNNEKRSSSSILPSSRGNVYSEDLSLSCAIYQTEPRSPSPSHASSSKPTSTNYTAFHDSEEEVTLANNLQRRVIEVTLEDSSASYVTSPPSNPSYANSLLSGTVTTVGEISKRKKENEKEEKKEMKNRFTLTKMSYSRIRLQDPLSIPAASFPSSSATSLSDDWNARFQQCLELPDGGEKYQSLSLLAYQFQVTATNYAKIIVSELSFPPEKRTIKPLDIGGAAGGEKYLVRGILFKFNYDVNNLYGGDEFAMKAAR